MCSKLLSMIPRVQSHINTPITMKTLRIEIFITLRLIFVFTFCAFMSRRTPPSPKQKHNFMAYLFYGANDQKKHKIL